MGGFSTAGMSLDDLAAAWGVGLDSAAALVDAGFADFGGGFGGDPASAESDTASGVSGAGFGGGGGFGDDDDSGDDDS
jgi:hypothetical protein